jgi:hypothetical protein
MKVKNFAGFMKTRRLNESDDMMGDYGMSPEDTEAGYYGANPEDEEDADVDAEDSDEEGETEELSLESLKAMIDDLTERVKKLEPEEEEEGEGENEEEEEGEAAPAE